MGMSEQLEMPFYSQGIRGSRWAREQLVLTAKPHLSVMES